MARTALPIALLFALGATPAWSPPRLVDGALPPPFATGDGAFVLYELRISRDGDVVEARELDAASSFGSGLHEELLTWRFDPATVPEEGAVGASVLVVGVSRAPKIPELSGALGPMPKKPEYPAGADELPRVRRLTVPGLPPQARFDGIVLVEVDVDLAGDIIHRRVVHSSNGYDGVCLDAVTHWDLEPGRLEGKPVTTRAYVVCNFRPTLTGGPVDRALPRPGLGARGRCSRTITAKPGMPPTPRARWASANLRFDATSIF